MSRDDDDLRFGDVNDRNPRERRSSTNGLSGIASNVQGLIDLIIQLMILGIVLFVCWKIIEVLLPLL